MNTCRLTTADVAHAEGYVQFTTAINHTTAEGRRILENILRDARANNCDHVCVEESRWHVSVWRKGYINENDTAGDIAAEDARRKMINTLDGPYRGLPTFI